MLIKRPLLGVLDIDFLLLFFLNPGFKKCIISVAKYLSICQNKSWDFTTFLNEIDHSGGAETMSVRIPRTPERGGSAGIPEPRVSNYYKSMHLKIMPIIGMLMVF